MSPILWFLNVSSFVIESFIIEINEIVIISLYPILFYYYNKNLDLYHLIMRRIIMYIIIMDSF